MLRNEEVVEANLDILIERLYNIIIVALSFRELS